jgi:hypothetical protein
LTFNRGSLVVRSVPLTRVRNVLLNGDLGELPAVAGIGLALARIRTLDP